MKGKYLSHFKRLNFPCDYMFAKWIPNTRDASQQPNVIRNLNAAVSVNIRHRHLCSTDLLRASVEASGLQLPLAEPPAQQVGVHLVQLPGERQEAGAAVNLTDTRNKSRHLSWQWFFTYDTTQEGKCKTSHVPEWEHFRPLLSVIYSQWSQTPTRPSCSLISVNNNS